MPIIERAPGTLDLFEDIGSLGGPDERLGALVVFVDVFSDGHDQFFGDREKHRAVTGFA